MSTFTLRVKINPEDLQTLTESGYYLCLARKCNESYTVVWYGNTKFIADNLFQWTEEYQVFGINEFKVGSLAQSATTSERIASGQACVINSYGVLNHATGNVDESGRFSIVNNYGKIGFGVSCKFGKDFYPFYITPVTPLGTVLFQPTSVIQVWFSLTQKTRMMISATDSDPIEVVYESGETDKTVIFKDLKWTSPQ